ncbi:hypothetical protein [Marinobacterium arenosum]|uniref:hypothetical protein n=1 Tax=Marinobacterium arenosum TaxID=2862496 RepID=UPI001C96EE74|nr:hypothetical protein [Marinobacterium arenosum]MBY4675699.1 hypothetical protein [Marinobacterium arenosum]
MDHRTIAAVLNSSERSSKNERERQQLATELRQRAEQLRDEGQHAAEFWLAEQYEISARLLN